MNADQIIESCRVTAVKMHGGGDAASLAYQITLLESKLREVVVAHNRIYEDFVPPSYEGRPTDRAHMRDMPSPAADGAALARKALVDAVPRIKTTPYAERAPQEVAAEDVMPPE